MQERRFIIHYIWEYVARSCGSYLNPQGDSKMRKTLGLRLATVAAGLALLLALLSACTEVREVPGETVVVEKEVVKEVQVPARPSWWRERGWSRRYRSRRDCRGGERGGQGGTDPWRDCRGEKEVVKEVEVPGETVVVEKEVVKEVVKTVEVVATPVPMAEMGFVLRAVQANPTRGGVVKTAWGLLPPTLTYTLADPSWVMGIAYNSLIRKKS